MPSFQFPRLHLSVLLLLMTIHVTLSRPTFLLPTSSRRYSAIFSFGDSISDTENFILITSRVTNAGKLPYGETYFRRSTGPFSDGRIILDFIGQGVGLPLVPPYLCGRTAGQDFRRGVNFAVGGATALYNDLFRERGLVVRWTNFLLGVQVGCFKQLIPSLCSGDSECKQLLGRSLFMMGEIGGNDYNEAFFQGLLLEETQSFIHKVIDAIGSAINDLIELGGRTIVVPGNFPIGCISRSLACFGSQSIGTGYYDPQTGCVNWLIDFAELHNRQLKEELVGRLRRCHPHATIIYADYYEAAMSLFRFPQKLALSATSSCYPAIFSFGDSINDTGNLIRSTLDTDYNKFPYGETSFDRPTGRCSNGFLIIDFIAKAVGLPLLLPSLGGQSAAQEFKNGVNFAVAGATAHNNGFFNDKGLNATWTDNSLDVQIGSFNQLLPSVCSGELDCRGFLGRSLFVMGEIGGNDYNYAFFGGLNFNEIQTFVPGVVRKISSAINALINLGAKTIIVPGIFPNGCLSSFLTIYQRQNTTEGYYDPQTGCINWLNEFSEHHNTLLKEELVRLRGLHPDITIVYADYYRATLNIYRNPQQFGIEATLKACCGGEGPYNYNLTVGCGNPAMKLCDDPSKYICWDGMHLTEAAYKVIANGVLEGPYADPPIGRKPYVCDAAVNN